MIYMFIMFFFFLYALCEMLKYKKLETLKIKAEKRLYNKKIVFIKAFVLLAFIVCIIVNRIFMGNVENSAGFKSVILLIVFLAIISIPTVIDIKRVLSGYNEEILSKLSCEGGEE